MRDLWLICERCCCEEPCLIFIGGGGQTCERQQKPCVTRGDRTLEWWRPLTKEDIKEYEPEVKNGIMIPNDTDADTNYKMNPPLRSKEDVEALKMGLRDNIMDVISTDHAPHTFEEKNTSMKNAPFGIVGLETAACLTHDELVLKGYLTPMQMAEKMSYNPAKVIGIDKGDIQPGKIADVVIFDPKCTYTIDKNKFASKGRNTPFHGRQVTGKVRCTICDGNVVYQDEEA